TSAVPYGVVQPYASLGYVPFVSPGSAFINTQPGGDGEPIYGAGATTNLMSQVSRGIVMALLDGDITESIKWKGSLYYGKVSSDNTTGGSATTLALLNCNQNAYTAASVSPSLNAACNNSPFLGIPGIGGGVNKDWTSQVPGETQFSTRVERATFGLTGKFGSSTWTWDANYEYGLTHHNQMVLNNIHNYAMSMALDSVLNPVTGQPECRVTAAGGLAGVLDPKNPYFNPGASYATANPLIANGCVAINPFGN